MKVTVSKHQTSKGFKWVVSRGRGKARVRSYWAAKALAEGEAANLRNEIAQTGHTFAGLKPSEKMRLMTLYSEAEKRGLALESMISKALESPSLAVPDLKTAVDELVKGKTGAGRSKPYVTNLKNILKQFTAGRERTPINLIGLADVESFIQTNGIRSRPTIRARLSTLFKFSMRRGYRLDNPCQRLEPITLPKDPPSIFTIEQVQTCLSWLRKNAPHALGWYVLTTLCGLRPEEAEKTRREDIHAKEEWIKIEAQTTKVRQRRVVYPKTEAMALLRSVLKKSRLPIGGHTARRIVQGNDWKVKDKATGKWETKHRDGLRDALGLDAWPKDITRHTAASYWLADCRSVSDVAHSLGNSEKILLRHYRALVTKGEAQRFWSAIQ